MFSVAFQSFFSSSHNCISSRSCFTVRLFLAWHSRSQTKKNCRCLCFTRTRGDLSLFKFFVHTLLFCHFGVFVLIDTCTLQGQRVVCRSKDCYIRECDTHTHTENILLHPLTSMCMPYFTLSNATSFEALQCLIVLFHVCAGTVALLSWVIIDYYYLILFHDGPFFCFCFFTLIYQSHSKQIAPWMVHMFSFLLYYSSTKSSISIIANVNL